MPLEISSSSLSASLTPTAPRSGQSTIGLPVQRIEQLRALATARGHATLVALVEDVIRRAAEDGEISCDVPGYVAVRDEDSVMLEMRGELSLPWMPPLKALLVATVLDAAAGVSVAPLEFSLPAGKAMPIDLGSHVLTIGRHGRGVLVLLEDKASGETQRLAEHSGIIADFASQIRRALEDV